jgi:predicted RNA-binding Zn-ribbon protein involved in translation (DUF1610 family)
MTDTLDRARALVAFRAVQGAMMGDDPRADFAAYVDAARELKEIERTCDIDTLNAISGSPVCHCGHARGMHGAMTRCLVGHDKQNRSSGRNDPYCNCTWFMEAAEMARMLAEDAATRQANKAAAAFLCKSCDDGIDDPTERFECGNCGNEQEESGNCEACGRFVGKMDGDYCPDCGDELTANDGTH